LSHRIKQLLVRCGDFDLVCVLESLASLDFYLLNVLGVLTIEMTINEKPFKSHPSLTIKAISFSVEDKLL
jgi:hypothetical protein